MDDYGYDEPAPRPPERRPARIWQHGSAGASWAVLDPDEYCPEALELFAPTGQAFINLLENFNGGELPATEAGLQRGVRQTLPPGAIGIEISPGFGPHVVVQVMEDAEGYLELVCTDAAGVVRYDNPLQAANWFMARLPAAYQKLLPRFDLPVTEKSAGFDIGF